MPIRVINAKNQKQALIALAQLTADGIIHNTDVRRAALAITNDCPSRNDECELEAIFEAVKHGDSRVRGLEKGLRYVADPRMADYFTAPGRMLQLCGEGACGGDCDDHSVLVASLAGAVGFKVGLRVYGKIGEDYSHVYAVAALPKRARMPRDVVGLDTTVPSSFVGWEPPPGRVMTAWLPDDLT